MHKHLLSLAMLLLLAGISIQAQDLKTLTLDDYRSYPHYMEMMLDPGINFFETQKAFNAFWEGKEITRGSGFKQFKRWEYYWQYRINQDGTFPDPRMVFDEYTRYQQQHPISDRMKTGQLVWEELGPKTRQDYGGYVGVGRVNAIAFHPVDVNTIYAGAPSGGLWVTHDNGSSWDPLTEELPTLGVSAIFIHPLHPEQILIGTGDRDGGDAPGMGTMKTLDGGTTWDFSNEGMGSTRVGMFAVHETNPDIIIAASGNGIYKTEDGGDNWVRTSPDQSNYRDIKYRPGDMTRVYATSNTGFYRSIDSGETWTRVGTDEGMTAPGRKVIGVTPANDSLVYVVAGGGPFQGCFLSRDFGATFTLQSDQPNILGYAYEANDDKSQAGYDLYLLADKVNPNVIIVGGINIWRSDDAGKTWVIKGHWWGDRTNEVHADQHTIERNPLNDRIYVGNDGGVYLTDNLGDTWTEISEGLGIGQLYKLGVSNTNRYKVVTGFQDNGSATWMGTHWVNSGGGDGMECAIDPFNDSYSYTTLYYGAITRYVNNGSSRRVAGENSNGIDESGAWVAPFLIGHDPNILIVGMKNIWMTRNVKDVGTIVYNKLTNNFAGRNDVNMAELKQSPADFNILYAGRGDGIFFRTDNLLDHPTWSNLTSSLPQSGTVSDIECHPYDANTVYITSSTKVFKSIDKGAHWEDITGSLPNIFKSDIVYDKTSDEGLYVATDAGVYFKNASMEDWELYSEGLPVSIRVTELEIYYDRMNRSDSRLRASSFGRGLWEIGLVPGVAFLPPTLLVATEGADYIDLQWESPFYPQTITGYNLYRNNEVIATINGTSYTDQDVETDVTYFYTVSAIYGNSDESAHSNLAMATIVAPIELDYAQNFEKGTAGWAAKFTFEGWKYGNATDLGIENNDTKFFGISSVAAGAGIHVSDYLYTPPIDLSSYTGKTITLKFNFALRDYRLYDKLYVVYRTSPDSAWKNIEKLKYTSRAAWVWLEYQVNLPEEALVSGTQVGFQYDDSNEHAWGAGVDDIQLFVNTTSIFTMENTLDVEVYPNPVLNQLSLKIKNSEPGNIDIKVYTLSGQLVYMENCMSGGGDFAHPVDLSSLASGLYQVVVVAGDGVWKEKINKQ